MPRHTGFTMIEVLLAMFILGSGAMAVLMMQLHALRSARDGLLRSQAMMLVAELAELRGEAGLAGGDDPWLFDFDSRRAPPATGSGDCRGQPCTRRDFAIATRTDWQTRLARALPGARAVICRDMPTTTSAASPGNWDCDGLATSPVRAKLGWARGTPDAGPALVVLLGR